MQRMRQAAFHGLAGGEQGLGQDLVTQCLLQHKPKTFAINVEGELGHGVTGTSMRASSTTTGGRSGSGKYL